MTHRMDTEALRALESLRTEVTDEDLHESGRYFHDNSFRDLTRCSHGDTGNYSEDADGKAIALLWNMWRSGALNEVFKLRAALARIQMNQSLHECQQIANAVMAQINGKEG